MLAILIVYLKIKNKETMKSNKGLDQINKMKCVSGIEITGKNIGPKPLLKITVSKSKCLDGDINMINEILANQNMYDWSIDFVP